VSSFLWADKPAGLTTHTSLNPAERRPWTDLHDGFMEWLSLRVGRTLFPVHRLDRETTGVIAFALDRESAARARELFEGREVVKEYLLLTDRVKNDATAASERFEVSSFIEREGNQFVSRRDREANARTVFEKIEMRGRFTLWRARPLTGKPHQIRLHAQDAGLPLLGDIAHGGSEFPALCLHAHKITLEGETHEAPPPLYFTDLSLLDDPRLVRWLAACDRRERATRSVAAPASATVRAIHTEGDPLRVERLGPVTSLNWFRDTYPTDVEWTSIARLLEIKGWTTWYLQIRTDRGKDPQTDRQLESTSPPPERWTAQENGLTYEFRRETGLSPGLFLDQRQNRKWIEETSQGERVLNLFCYTGGFSVAAAKGGARQVVSVDVSKTFLEWAKRNFELNDLDLSPHEFRAIDSGEYLAWAAKKGLKFDTVICDPPSFARTNTRGKSKVFRIEQEFPELLKACAAVATKRILFSTNFERWSLDDFAQMAEKALPGKSVCATPSADLDFELPRQPRHMKAIVIEL
jgi:23S rRNA (cytosine1962-C5)-methyltransferase